MSIDDLHFIRRGKTLVPADFHAEEFLDKMKEGGDVILKKSTLAKSAKQQRWFRAVMAYAHKHLPEDIEKKLPTPDALVDAVKIATGKYDWRRTVLGGRYEHPHSIADMGHDEFNEWSHLAIDVVANMIGISSEKLIAEAEQSWRRR